VPKAYESFNLGLSNEKYPVKPATYLLPEKKFLSPQLYGLSPHVANGDRVEQRWFRSTFWMNNYEISGVTLRCKRWLVHNNNHFKRSKFEPKFLDLHIKSND
jgi:hypothetical protein